MIDLRSDTLTRPSPEMVQAMVSVRLGDDNFGEDAATNELEEHCAALLGKQAAVFVPTGTMSNQIALRLHTRPGDDVILDASYHVNTYESAPSADLAGVCLHPVDTGTGMLTPGDIDRAIDAKARDPRYARPALLALENTVNHRAGRVVPLGLLQTLFRHARGRGMRVHLDGARLFNASVASRTPLESYGTTADTISVCFAKGLGAPVGSVLAGDAELMDQARYYRKSYGGALHQSGHLAAAALFALRHNIARLQDDHAAARLLAERLARQGLLDVEGPVDTNMVIVDTARSGITAAGLAEALADKSVLAMPVGAHRLRFVTHLHITTADVRAAADATAAVTDTLRAASTR
ncbi:threonine aldolase family protein [Kitasatospora sp. NPDC088346]|uniref:threonine aldolase family protein n=1 Tax=Kitasatospora sp. NPDC088346 TaxID=3364073 RepID=UPI0037F284FD